MVYDLAVYLLLKQVDIREILYWDEVIDLKMRLLLKALWLLSFLFFSILLSIKLSQLSAIILPLELYSWLECRWGLANSYNCASYKTSFGGIVDSGRELLFSSLWELFAGLGVN